MAAKLPPKKDVALALLEKASVYVHLDPRKDQVVVPPWFKKQAQLVLQVGLNMAVSIPDLDVDDECLSCTLSFNRSPFFCWIPWTAVYALVGEDGRGMVWPDEIPPEVAAQARKPVAKQPEEPPPAARRGHLRAVAGDSAGDAAAPVPPAAAAAGEAARDASSPPRVDEPEKSSGGGAPVAAVAAAPPAPPEPQAGATPAVPADAAEPVAPAGAGPEGAPAEASSAADAEASSAADAEPASKKKLPPYLRIVK